jgi:hypothetical protein
MNGIERTHHVLQPFRASGTNPEQRRKKPDGRPFELEPADAALDAQPRTDSASTYSLPSTGGDEGVGEHVNIVV